MHRALLVLLWMQVRGWVRRQFTGGSVRRTVFAVLGGLMFLVWLSSVALGAAFQKAKTPEEILATLPLYLTGFVLMSVFMGNDDRAIAFSPAEIDFLFPGPFSRRDLVLFKLLKLVLSSLAGGIFFSLMFRRFAGSFASCMVGMALAMVFINLLTTVVALVRDRVAEKAYGLVRRGAMVVLLGTIAGIVWYATRSQEPGVEALKRLTTSAPGRLLLAPAGVFAHVLAAGSAGEFMGWVAACIGLICGAGVLVLALDQGFMEAALSASERRQAKLARRSRGVVIATDKPVKELRLPGLGALGPAGAIVRKQLIVALRTSRGWMLGFVFVAGYGYFMARVAGGGKGAPGFAGLIPGFLIILLMLPQMLRFDFRGDLDHMEGLKALPISPGGIALAEMAVPTAILSLLGLMIVAGVAVFMELRPSMLAMVALAVPPAGIVVMGLENFVFLILPTRVLAAGQGGMAMGGRRVLMMLARLALFAVGGGLVAVAGFAAWTMTGSVAGTYVSCWLALLLIAAGVVRAVAWAFTRFDVSVDMPV